MSKIGIISGGGKLPILIGNSLVKKNYEVVYFIIEDSVERKNYLNLNSVEIKLNSIKKIFNKLEENFINKIILAGNIKRPSIKDINFDFETINFAQKLFLSKKGDNELLIAIAKLFIIAFTNSPSLFVSINISPIFPSSYSPVWRYTL